MLYKLLVAFVLAVALTASVQAACNSICRQKCQENPGSQTVANCIKLWSCINEKYGAGAGKFENAQPPAKCKHLFKSKN